MDTAVRSEHNAIKKRGGRKSNHCGMILGQNRAGRRFTSEKKKQKRKGGETIYASVANSKR